MKKIVLLFLCFIYSSGIMAQNCTKELAALQPSVFEKSTGYNGYRATDPVVKKNGTDILDLILASIKDATGLHGFSDISNSNDGTGGLSAFSSDLHTYNIYCQIGGGFNWKGLYNFEMKCMVNNLSNIIDDLTDQDIGIGPNKEVMVNNSPVYTYNSSGSHDQMKGYPYYESHAGGGVLVTKPGATLFKPISRREYFVIMRKSVEATLDRLKKKLAELLQTISAVEMGSELYKGYKEVVDMNNKMVEDAVNNLKDINSFTAAQTEAWMNKPCITNHSFASPFNHPLASIQDYFADEPGDVIEWVIINPDYLNKKVPLTAPQFFFISWRPAESIAEKKALDLFKENFDFDKLQSLLVK